MHKQSVSEAYTCTNKTYLKLTHAQTKRTDICVVCALDDMFFT